MRFHVRRSMALALAAAVTLTSFNLPSAQAAAPKGAGQQATESTSTDFSARRRWHRGNRAVLGAAIGVFGAIAAIAAAERYRDRYYYGGPHYYGYGPYYGGAYGYGQAYPYWGHRHWR